MVPPEAVVERSPPPPPPDDASCSSPTATQKYIWLFLSLVLKNKSCAFAFVPFRFCAHVFSQAGMITRTMFLTRSCELSEGGPLD